MPHRKPTVAIAETDLELAALWQRKFTHAGFDVVGTFSSLSTSGGRGRGEGALGAQTIR